MKIDWSEPGVPLSVIAHAAVLVASLVALSSAQPLADAQESVPVEIITADQFSAMTKGEQAAQEVQPTPRVDTVAEAEQLKPTQGTNVTDVPTPPTRAPEVSEAASAPPLPPTRPPDPVKPEEKAEPAKVELPPEPPKVEAEIPKPPEKPQPPKVVKPPEPPKEVTEKPKPPEQDKLKIAQLLEDKKREEQKKPVKPPAREKGEPDFAKTQNDIQKLLMSKDKPQATGSVGAQLQKTAALGTQSGNSPKLSPSMTAALIGLLKEQVHPCFELPPGIDETKIVQGKVRVVFKEDGSLAERPQVASLSSDPGVRAVAGALQRAIIRCAPYRIPAQFLPFFEQWKDTLFEPPASMG